MAILFLEDGTSWEGHAFGFEGEATGEAVFNTAFSGYEEVLTDPSYAGQIVVMTVPHLGNYGITLADMESSRCYLRGFVVKEKSPIDSNWRSKEALDKFLKDEKVVGLCDVDTRGMVKHLRRHGAMRAILSSKTADKKALLEKVKKSPSMIGADFMDEVTVKKPVRHAGKGPRVVLYDFGLKQNILNELLTLGFDVTVVPANTTAAEALKLNPQGIVFSNGPGDPAALEGIVKEIKELLKKKLPTLGICLGNQLLSLALGAKTYKLPFGHRGVNHPVKNLATNEVAITSHNHGFAIDAKSLAGELSATYIDLYDGTLEGFRHNSLPVISVQFHPEAAPGPHDAAPIFESYKQLFENRV